MFLFRNCSRLFSQRNLWLERKPVELFNVLERQRMKPNESMLSIPVIMGRFMLCNDIRFLTNYFSRSINGHWRFGPKKFEIISYFLLSPFDKLDLRTTLKFLFCRQGKFSLTDAQWCPGRPAVFICSTDKGKTNHFNSTFAFSLSLSLSRLHSYLGSFIQTGRTNINHQSKIFFWNKQKKSFPQL